MQGVSSLAMIKWLSIFCVAICICIVGASFAVAQSRGQADILMAYEQNEISAETAILEQFELAYNTDLSSSAHQHLPPVKCLTPAYMMLERHRHELSNEALQKIEAYAAQTQRASQEVYYSASGKFAIHYDTSGENAVPDGDENLNDVPDYVEWVGQAADSSYRHEVLALGFRDPVPPGSTYNVYLSSLGAGYYGRTNQASGGGAETEIYVHNNFLVGFPGNTDPQGNQRGAIKVTVAHELKHAIQYLTNRFSGPSGSVVWGEIDATLMEEIVYDNVNDYYNYIKVTLSSSQPSSQSVFGNPQKSIPGNGYNHITWMLHYAEAYGMEIWTDVWDRIHQNTSLGIEKALEIELPSYNTSFGESFVQNHLWHFASGVRAGDSEYGFEEKEFYPTSTLRGKYSWVPSEPDSISHTHKLAAHYFEISPNISNRGIIDLAVNFDSTQVGLGVLIYTKTGEIREYIVTGENKGQVYLPLEDHHWQDIDKMGIVVANYSMNSILGETELLLGTNEKRFKITDPLYQARPEQLVLYQNYPNPFNPTTNIEFELDNISHVLLEVYDITGRKVRTLKNESMPFGHHKVPFSARNLASGIYLYRLQTGDRVRVKKMTLIK
ncbi:MAG: T9SS type A sorting domain-containing protein [Balneolaceae bacterium]|nr:T9SS type A sorting domain-containing protein [Balneolaceae bacterium]